MQGACGRDHGLAASRRVRAPSTGSRSKKSRDCGCGWPLLRWRLRPRCGSPVQRGSHLVLTSATLCVGSPPEFDFIQSRLGLDAAETLALGSPFDYARQVTVHLPSNLPDPASRPDAFEEEAILAIAFYLEQTHGKAFVLFTSHRMLTAAAGPGAMAGGPQDRPLRPERRNAAIEDGRDVQVRRRQRDLRRRYVLAGRGCTGRPLSNVIITRLPFAVPSHPLLERGSSSSAVAAAARSWSISFPKRSSS